MVVLLDELETKGLVARERSLEDRRSQQLQSDMERKPAAGRVERIATAHDADLGSSLTLLERETLIDLCAKLAAHCSLARMGTQAIDKRSTGSRSNRKLSNLSKPEYLA